MTEARRGRRLARLALVSLLAALSGWLVVTGLAAHTLTARPHPVRPESPPVGFSVEELRLRTADGVELGAWFRAGEPGRAVVVLAHGMGGSRTSLGPAMRRVAELGHGALAVTLRGFGDSQGERLDFGIRTRADLIAAVEAAEERAQGAPIVVIGQSLGAAAALFAAGELGPRVAGYILEAPYLTLEKACRDRLAQHLLPLLDELAYRGLALWAPLFLPEPIDSIRPLDACAELAPSAQVLFIAGSADLLAPSEDVRTLSRTSRAPAEFVELAGRDHEDLWHLDLDHFELWRGFLRRIEAQEESRRAR